MLVAVLGVLVVVVGDVGGDVVPVGPDGGPPGGEGEGGEGEGGEGEGCEGVGCGSERSRPAVDVQVYACTSSSHAKIKLLLYCVLQFFSFRVQASGLIWSTHFSSVSEVLISPNSATILQLHTPSLPSINLHLP